jgi:hypothetical protein
MYKKMGDVKSVVTLYVEAQVTDTIIFIIERNPSNLGNSIVKTPGMGYLNFLCGEYLELWIKEGGGSGVLVVVIFWIYDKKFLEIAHEVFLLPLPHPLCGSMGKVYGTQKSVVKLKKNYGVFKWAL